MAVRFGAFGHAAHARWPWFLDVVPAAILGYLIIAENSGR
jgi:hypothetical protein